MVIGVREGMGMVREEEEEMEEIMVRKSTEELNALGFGPRDRRGGSIVPVASSSSSSIGLDEELMADSLPEMAVVGDAYSELDKMDWLCPEDVYLPGDCSEAGSIGVPFWSDAEKDSSMFKDRHHNYKKRSQRRLWTKAPDYSGESWPDLPLMDVENSSLVSEEPRQDGEESLPLAASSEALEFWPRRRRKWSWRAGHWIGGAERSALDGSVVRGTSMYEEELVAISPLNWPFGRTSVDMCICHDRLIPGTPIVVRQKAVGMDGDVCGRKEDLRLHLEKEMVSDAVGVDPLFMVELMELESSMRESLREMEASGDRIREALRAIDSLLDDRGYRGLFEEKLEGISDSGGRGRTPVVEESLRLSVALESSVDNGLARSNLAVRPAGVLHVGKEEGRRLDEAKDGAAGESVSVEEEGNRRKMTKKRRKKNMRIRIRKRILGGISSSRSKIVELEEEELQANVTSALDVAAEASRGSADSIGPRGSGRIGPVGPRSRSVKIDDGDVAGFGLDSIMCPICRGSGRVGNPRDPCYGGRLRGRNGPVRYQEVVSASDGCAVASPPVGSWSGMKYDRSVDLDLDSRGGLKARTGLKEGDWIRVLGRRNKKKWSNRLGDKGIIKEVQDIGHKSEEELKGGCAMDRARTSRGGDSTRMEDGLSLREWARLPVCSTDVRVEVIGRNGLHLDGGNPGSDGVQGKELGGKDRIVDDTVTTLATIPGRGPMTSSSVVAVQELERIGLGTKNRIGKGCSWIRLRWQDGIGKEEKIGLRKEVDCRELVGEVVAVGGVRPAYSEGATWAAQRQDGLPLSELELARSSSSFSVGSVRNLRMVRNDDSGPLSGTATILGRGPKTLDREVLEQGVVRNGSRIRYRRGVRNSWSKSRSRSGDWCGNEVGEVCCCGGVAGGGSSSNGGDSVSNWPGP
ncbi:hypothetical protein EAI_17547 [Harpegnathos saltator]|uniref:Uncharacterized protein n=1 Tax=Harpegnathos saltator TaxID=610380 RepID=E2BIB5_HARSA|nr:hypothetical protein EAI_17547 [Harpegnathos saltator]